MSALLRLLLIVVLALLLSAWLLGCVALLPRYLPKPPRRHLTIEKAQQWRARYDTPAMRNRRYYRAYPR